MTEQSRGQYIVIEGTDGAGTTTQKELLIDYLQQNGKPVVDIAEPGGTPIGDNLRLIIKDGSLARSPETNFDLFTVCRRELARQVIEPSIAAGSYVVSDRNWFSTVAYQGFGEGLATERIIERMRTTLGNSFMPDFAVIVDVPVGVSEERLRQRGTSVNDHFEQMSRPFFEKVRSGYLWVAEEFEIPIVDGTQSIDIVHAGVRALLGDLAVGE